MDNKADRFNEGKLRWSLVDFGALEEMVKVLEFGAQKYTDHNWKKGLSITSILDSMMRHQVAFLNGKNIDPESGLPHTGHIMCNAMFLAHMFKYKAEVWDDRKGMPTKKELEDFTREMKKLELERIHGSR
jgi:hypothetical protein